MLANAEAAPHEKRGAIKGLSRRKARLKFVRPLMACLMAGTGMTVLGACQGGYSSSTFVEPLSGSPVHSNNTPYTACLDGLARIDTNNRPVFAVGQISDKTGQNSYGTYNDSTELTQGVSEMVISALFKTRQVSLTERLDIRVPLVEQQLVEANAFAQAVQPLQVLPANFVVLGALTELNYNILSGGARLYIGGVGGGVRTAVVNVGLDMRLVDVRSFRTLYVVSLQKQIVGYEVEAGIYRFFGDHLVEFDAGAVKNEPLQLGVRSVVELATYQILTEGLGLPAPKQEGCEPGVSTEPAANSEEKTDA